MAKDLEPVDFVTRVSTLELDQVYHESKFEEYRKSAAIVGWGIIGWLLVLTVVLGISVAWLYKTYNYYKGEYAAASSFITVQTTYNKKLEGDIKALETRLKTIETRFNKIHPTGDLP